MTAVEVIAQAGTLLLDFDGPVCDVFASMPASLVADQLRQILADGGHAELPESAALTEDPFDVLRYAATVGESEGRLIDFALRAHEVEAIAGATPTRGAHDLIRSWHASGQPLAIVSNNSFVAIDAYLNLYDLSSSVDTVVARTSYDPNLLKPNPYLLRKAINALGVTPEVCVLIGDSPSDIVSASVVGVRSIGYVNKPNKRTALGEADFLIESISDLTPIR